MASSASKRRTTMDMLTCSICMSTFIKPKSLTCSHNFCLDCLQDYVDTNEFTDEMPCPLCREMFSIPPQGLNSLPDDYLIKNLIELEKSTEMEEYIGTEVKCDLFKKGQEESHSSPAQLYCAECEQYLCLACADTHGRLWLTRLHTTVPLNRMGESTGAPTPDSRDFCDKHSDEVLRLYCTNCEMMICNICLNGEHEGHNAEEINDTIKTLRDKLQTRMSELEKASNGFIGITQRLNEMEENIRTESQENQATIKEKCNEMRLALDLYEEELLNDNKKSENAIVSYIKTELTEVELLKVRLGEFKIYLEKIADTMNNSDITYNGREILKRSERLLLKCAEHLSNDSMPVKHSKFIKHSGEEFQIGIIGHFIRTTEDPPELFLSPCSSVTFINHGRPINGITVIENEIFVLQQPPPQIHVYDEGTLALKRNITTQSLTTPRDLAGCSHYKSLYISDSYTNEIQKIDLLAKNPSRTWKIVNGSPMGLSVTAGHNLLITIRKKGNNRVIECDIHGQQLRTVNFHSSVRYPTQTLHMRLPEERFLVCHGVGLLDLHRVCMVDAEGLILKEYGKRGHGERMLSLPNSIILEQNGKNIFVADYENSRIHLLDNELNFLGYVATPPDHAYPLNLFYNSEKRKLYVSEYSKRILIMELPFFKSSPSDDDCSGSNNSLEIG